jgi:hypothetical protein
MQGTALQQDNSRIAQMLSKSENSFLLVNGSS